jgi:hypothetical protein
MLYFAGEIIRKLAKMNAAIILLKRAQKNILKTKEVLDEIHFNNEDYEKVEKEESKINWICDNH